MLRFPLRYSDRHASPQSPHVHPRAQSKPDPSPTNRVFQKFLEMPLFSSLRPLTCRRSSDPRTPPRLGMHQKPIPPPAPLEHLVFHEYSAASAILILYICQ